MCRDCSVSVWGGGSMQSQMEYLRIRCAIVNTNHSVKLNRFIDRSLPVWAANNNIPKYISALIILIVYTFCQRVFFHFVDGKSVRISTL